MAKYENEGYCPANDVAHFCCNTCDDCHPDSRLAGLWSIISSSVVCISEESHPAVDKDAVYKMFTSDPIAVQLMTEIIKYNATADKIAVRQPTDKIPVREPIGGILTLQYFNDIQKTLVETKNPKLLLCSGSEFAVIIAEAEYGIDVYFWHLTCCR